MTTYSEEEDPERDRIVNQKNDELQQKDDVIEVYKNRIQNLTRDVNQKTAENHTLLREKEELIRTISNLRKDVGLAEQIIGEVHETVPHCSIVLENHGTIHLYTNCN